MVPAEDYIMKLLLCHSLERSDQYSTGRTRVRRKERLIEIQKPGYKKITAFNITLFSFLHERKFKAEQNN